MAGEIKLPVIGQVKTKWVIAGAAAVALIVGVSYYRHRGSAAAASTTAGTDAAAAAADSSIDPETGYPEGSPQDEEALSSLSSGAGLLGTDYGDGEYYGSLGTVLASNTGPGTFTSNAYWLQYAMANITGYSASQIQASLSAYLSGAPLDATGYSIYQIALGVAGAPPNPPATPAPPAATPVATGTTTTPGTSSSAPAAAVTGNVTGLGADDIQTSSVHLAWHAVAHAQGYEIKVYTGNSENLAESESVTTPSASVTGLKPKTKYRFDVRAKPGASHNSVYATTK